MIGSNETEQTFGFFGGLVARCVECGKGGLPIGVTRGADALEGFERHPASAVVFALHACQPPGKPLRGKGVARGRYLCLAWLVATQGNMPAIGAQYCSMIGPATGTRIFLACGHTDMRRGMDGLAALVQQAFGQDPFCGAVYLFRGKRGRLIKCVWHDGQGLCLFAKRLECGYFPWPVTNTGTIMLSAAQASMLLEGIDWRTPQRTWRPSAI